MVDLPEDVGVVVGGLRWLPNDQGIGYLVERGRLDRVVPSRRAGEHLVDEARRHLVSSQMLAGTDDMSMAFVAAYDAARKALAAVLAVQGLRARGGEGGHTVMLDAVRPQFPDQRRELQRFDWLRTIRNNIEYPDLSTPAVTIVDVTQAHAAATQIVDIAGRFVGAYTVC